MQLQEKARSVTGIDLSEEMIGTALRSARRKNLTNVTFELRDASSLSHYKENEFDIAVTSMAVHQFDAELAVKIISEMKRIALTVIIVDYNYPMPEGLARNLAFGIERIAGGDHYRNFKFYMRNGGHQSICISSFRAEGEISDSQRKRGLPNFSPAINGELLA